VVRRSLRNWLNKKSSGRPALKPEMRGLIDSFDAHLQQRPVAKVDVQRHADAEPSASTADTGRSR
jgi:hypothetical protein